MGESRTRYAVRNVKWGLIYKLAMMLTPFATRTVMIYSLGSEYLGLSSLFTSVLNVLSLAELGFGTAMVYAMYKPVSQNDTETICALLNLYRKIYWLIGTIILVFGLILLPFIRRFISGDVPTDINVYILFGIYMANTVLSYYLFAYKSSLLTACQRNDIPTKVNMFTTIVKNLLQIVVLLLIRNYYPFAILLPLTTVAANIIISLCAKKYYPDYVCRGDIDRELKQEIKKKTTALLAVKITNVIYNSVDSIVISSFLGLIMLAKYNNYYYIMNAIIAIITVIYNSMTASIGNSIVTTSPEKNYRDYMNLSFINAWIVGWSTVCLYCLYQPFMKLWVGEDLLFESSVMVCFCIYFYVFQLKSVQSAYKDAAGLWREDMWRAYIANIFNLVLNLILVRIIGVYGILLSTILALLVITYPWQTWMIHKELFRCSMVPYILRLLIYTIVTVLSCFITQLVCNLVNGENVPAFFIKIVICVIVPNLLFLLAASGTEEFKVMLGTIKRMNLKN